MIPDDLPNSAEFRKFKRIASEVVEEYNGSFFSTSSRDDHGDYGNILIFIWDDQDDCDRFLEDDRVSFLEYRSADYTEAGILETCLHVKM